MSPPRILHIPSKSLMPTTNSWVLLEDMVLRQRDVHLYPLHFVKTVVRMVKSIPKEGGCYLPSSYLSLVNTETNQQNSTISRTGAVVNLVKKRYMLPWSFLFGDTRKCLLICGSTLTCVPIPRYVAGSSRVSGAWGGCKQICRTFCLKCRKHDGNCEIKRRCA